MGLFFSEQTGYTISPKVNKKIFTLCHECTLLLVFFQRISIWGQVFSTIFCLFVKLLEYILCIEKETYMLRTTYKIIRHSLGRFSGLNFIRGSLERLPGSPRLHQYFRICFINYHYIPKQYIGALVCVYIHKNVKTSRYQPICTTGHLDIWPSGPPAIQISGHLTI